MKTHRKINYITSHSGRDSVLIDLVYVALVNDRLSDASARWLTLRHCITANDVR